MLRHICSPPFDCGEFDACFTTLKGNETNSDTQTYIPTTYPEIHDLQMIVTQRSFHLRTQFQMHLCCYFTLLCSNNKTAQTCYIEMTIVCAHESSAASYSGRCFDAFHEKALHWHNHTYQNMWPGVWVISYTRIVLFLQFYVCVCVTSYMVNFIAPCARIPDLIVMLTVWLDDMLPQMVNSIHSLCHGDNIGKIRILTRNAITKIAIYFLTICAYKIFIMRSSFLKRDPQESILVLNCNLTL